MKEKIRKFFWGKFSDVALAPCNFIVAILVARDAWSDCHKGNPLLAFIEMLLAVLLILSGIDAGRISPFYQRIFLRTSQKVQEYRAVIHSLFKRSSERRKDS